MRIRFGRMFMPRCQSFKLTFVILVVVLNIFCEALRPFSFMHTM